MLSTKRRARAWALVLCAVVCLAFTAQAAEEAPRLVGVVNVNTASSAELQLLPGVGASRAQALIDLRKRRGGFQSLDELKEVKGIGDASLERMRPYVSLQGKTTARIE